MKGENENRRPSIVRTALEAIYIFMHILAPIVPVAAEEVFRRLGTRPRRLALLRNDFYNLSPGTKITIGDVLFKKMDSFQDSSLHAEPSHPIVSEDHQLDLTKLDLRVGVITKIWKHETSETLFCEEVDVGEESPRQIASGLRGFYLEDDLLNSKVVVVCNLKESKFRGFLSCGMVLAAKSETGAVEIIEADSEAVPGDRVFLSGHELVQPLSSAIIKKQKIWEKVSIDLRTDSSRALCWQHFPLINKRTGKNLTSKSLANVAVS